MNSRQRALSWPYPRYGQFQRQLQNAATDWFMKRGYSTHPKYPYILDQWKHWPRNIVVPEVADYIIELREDREKTDAFPLHKYIHHGLSSQAMLFNLIGPLMLNGDYSPLASALEQQGIFSSGGYLSAELEYEDREVFVEDAGQPTSVDLVLKAPEPADTLYIECKLSETEFGGCSVFKGADCDGKNPVGCLDSCYLHYIGRSYWDLLSKYGFLKTAIGTDSICVLANHYQFFRELLFALEKGGKFILLCDERNPAFYCKHKTDPTQTRGLMEYLTTLVPQSLQSRIGHVTVQQVLHAVKDYNEHQQWYAEFLRKCGLPSKPHAA